MSDEREKNAKSVAPNWRDQAKETKDKAFKSADDLMQEMKDKQADIETAAKKEAQNAKASSKNVYDKLGAEAKEVEDQAIAAVKSAKPAAKKAADAPAPAPAKNWTFIEDYTVKAGDNLSKISEKYYGNQGYWSQIYEANKATIGDNPNVVVPGTTIKIPKL